MLLAADVERRREFNDIIFVAVFRYCLHFAICCYSFICLVAAVVINAVVASIGISYATAMELQ